MLSKDKRLNLTNNFRWVAKGSFAQSPNLKMYWQFGKNTQALIGVSLAKSQFRDAVARNKIKRNIFQIIQKNYHNLNKSLNLVIMPKNSALDLSPDELEKELSYAKAIYISN